MSSNWSIEEDEVLINFVRSHEGIYNVKNKDHRKLRLKLSWWREIGEILSKTDTDCSKRWAYIRDYHIRIKRTGKLECGGEAAKKRSDLLSFLENIPSSQGTSISNTSGDNFVSMDNENGELTQNSEEESMEYNVETKFNPLELNNLVCKNNDNDKDESASAKNDIYLVDKMSANWSGEEDEVLINFVRSHEALYNVRHGKYRKKQLKRTWWREIGEILNKADADCAKRWFYIRDYYVRRRGKPGVSQGQAARKRAALLSFLDKFPSCQRTPGSKNSDRSPGDHFGTMDTENSELTQNSEEEYNIEYNVETKFNPLQNSSQNDLDETDLFFNSMAKIVKKLPPYEQAKLRIQIGSLVGNAELRNISQNSS